VQAEHRADLANLAGLALGILFIVILGPLERRLELAHINDFSGVWAGARVVVLGIDPYDPARGQWVFLLLGAVSAGVLALRADRPVRAGLLSLAFLLKPQLFVFTALRFFMHRGVALVAIAAGAAVVVISTALFPHWIGAWLSDVGPMRIVRSASLPVALSDLFGPAGTVVGYGLILFGFRHRVAVRPARALVRRRDLHLVV